MSRPTSILEWVVFHTMVSVKSLPHSKHKNIFLHCQCRKTALSYLSINWQSTKSQHSQQKPMIKTTWIAHLGAFQKAPAHSAGQGRRQNHCQNRNGGVINGLSILDYENSIQFMGPVALRLTGRKPQGLEVVILPTGNWTLAKSRY